MQNPLWGVLRECFLKKKEGEKKNPNILYVKLPIASCTHCQFPSVQISREDEGKKQSYGGYLLLGVLKTNDWLETELSNELYSS